MSDGFIRLPLDSTGKRLRTWELGDGTHAEAVVVVDADGNLVSAPESPQSQFLEALALPPFTPSALESDDIAGGTTGILISARLSSSVPCKAEIQTASGITFTTRGMVFSSFGELSVPWKPPAGPWVRLNGGSGNRWRVVVTNLSNSETVDAYVELFWDEVTT